MNAIKSSNVAQALREVGVSAPELALCPTSPAAQIEYLQRLKSSHPGHDTIFGFLIAEVARAAAPPPRRVSTDTRVVDARGSTAVTVSTNYDAMLRIASDVYDLAVAHDLPFGYRTIKAPGFGWTSARIEVSGAEELVDRFMSLASSYIG